MRSNKALQHRVHHSGSQSADNAAHYRYIGITPIAIALIGNGEDRMHDARVEITCWIDRKAGRPGPVKADTKQQ